MNIATGSLVYRYEGDDAREWIDDISDPLEAVTEYVVICDRNGKLWAMETDDVNVRPCADGSGYLVWLSEIGVPHGFSTTPLDALRNALEWEDSYAAKARADADAIRRSVARFGGDQ